MAGWNHRGRTGRTSVQKDGLVPCNRQRFRWVERPDGVIHFLLNVGFGDAAFEDDRDVLTNQAVRGLAGGPAIIW